VPKKKFTENKKNAKCNIKKVAEKGKGLSYFETLAKDSKNRHKCLSTKIVI